MIANLIFVVAFTAIPILCFKAIKIDDESDD